MNTKVAIKGIGGSFHDQAAQDAFGQAYTPLFCRSFIDIIRKVSGEEADFGIKFGATLISEPEAYA